jgi:hypothetical protein
MSFPSTSQTTVVLTNDTAQLRRFKYKLHEHFTRLYPTRHKPLCPPAYGALFETNCLELPGLQRDDGVQGLLVYLPQDYSPLAAAMVEQFPQVLVHPDIGLVRQRAYFSWAEQKADGKLPQTLWVPAQALQAALQANEDLLGRRALPLVFAAGNTVAVGELVQDDSQCQLALIALDNAKHPPVGYSPDALQKAQEKALLYSECPWYLMRYELKNANRRLAVNLAALCKMNPP